MTLPVERSRAIWNTREFLRSLMDPKITPRIPKMIRRQARWLLKHYPTDLDMEFAVEGGTEVFGKEKGYVSRSQDPSKTKRV